MSGKVDIAPRSTARNAGNADGAAPMVRRNKKLDRPSPRITMAMPETI
jgi:hypothetical protein